MLGHAGIGTGGRQGARPAKPGNVGELAAEATETASPEQLTTTMPSDERARIIRVGAEGKVSVLSFYAGNFTVTHEGWCWPHDFLDESDTSGASEGTRRVLEVPLRQVLWAHILDGNIEIHLLAKKKTDGALSLVNVNGQIQAGEQDAAVWMQELMNLAYKGQTT